MNTSAYIVIEGVVRDKAALTRYGSQATALAWYNAPAYQALLEIRNAALDCRFRLVG